MKSNTLFQIVVLSLLTNQTFALEKMECPIPKNTPSHQKKPTKKTECLGIESNLLLSQNVSSQEPLLFSPTHEIQENKFFVPRKPLFRSLVPPHRKKPAEIGLESLTADDESHSIWEREHLTGDWGGLRSKLLEHGIVPEVLYTGEAFGNVTGGQRRRGAYRGNIDLTLTVDTERLGLWEGGTLFVYGQHTHGRGISEKELGALQAISSIESPEFSQLSELYYQHSFFDDKLRFKIGKQDANAEFAALDYAVEFLHSSFGLMPNVPMPTFPAPELGATVFIKPTDGFSAAAGVFDTEGGSFSLTELTLKPVFSGLAGNYRAGVWLHDVDTDSVQNTEEPITLGSNYGFYLGFDQRLYLEADSEDQGLGAFFQLGWTPQDRNEMTLYVGGGLTYKGLFNKRDEDVMGLAVAHGAVSSYVTAVDNRTAETTIEMFYRFQLMPWLSVQPDMQLVHNPGGNEGKDAFVLGARTEINF